MPKVVPEHTEARRTQILEAARECILESGIHGASMRDIMSAAGLSTGAVYSYFESKEEIILALAEQVLAPQAMSLASVVAADDPLGALHALLDEFQAGMAALHLGGRALPVRLQFLGEATHQPEFRELARELVATVSGALAAGMRAAQEAGQIDAALDPDALGPVFTGLFQGLLIQLAIGMDTDIESYFAALHALLNGIAGG
jgi:TetR/AcrR family transcriptional regulator, transcriptional repressor of aconitase